MARTSFALALVTLLAVPAFAASVSGPDAALPPAGKPAWVPERVVPGDVLLQVKGLDAALLRRATHGDADARAQVDAALAALGDAGKDVRFVRRGPLDWLLLHADGLDETQTEALVKDLGAAPGVTGSAANRWMRPLRTPNDEFVDFMWHLEPIGAFAAWDVTQGLTSQRVGVIDSGTFRTHEDLVGKDAGGFDFISFTQASVDGDERDPDYTDPGDGGDCGFGFQPDSFHGSHVAGTILADADNGVGIAGINWNAQLVTARALGQCGGANLDILEAMIWLAGGEIDGVPSLPASERPRVINLSLGSAGACDPTSRDVLQAVSDAGVIPVIAAGNDGGPVGSPASCPAAIAVAAYGPGAGNPLASYSSFGPEIDIVGPGGEQREAFEDGVLSLYSTDTDPPYTFYQGTSMAAPHVTGVIALMLAVDPSLSQSEIVSILQSTGDSCSGCGGKIALRADRALLELDPVVTEPGDFCDEGRCSGGQICVDDVCQIECDADADCSGDDICDLARSVCVPPEPEDECNPQRGNMDCPNGFGCVLEDGLSLCIEGEDEGDEEGALCEDDDDCETGLCDRGVCTVTCDFDDGDCKDGFECDDGAAPGGLCRPEDCEDEDEDFCENGESCQLSPQDEFVCAEGDAPPPGPLAACGCTQQQTNPGSLALLAAALGAAVTRRRRRR